LAASARASGRGLLLALESVAGIPLFLVTLFCLVIIPAGLGVLLAPESLLVVRRPAGRDRRRQWHRGREAEARRRAARDRAAAGRVRRGDRGDQPAGRADPGDDGAAVRVVLGEDLTLLRDGLIRLFAAYDMDVVAVDNGPDLRTALVTQDPDVAVVDVRLPPTFTNEGLKAAIEARVRVPGLPVLVLSQHVEPLYAQELLATGPHGLGYLLKDRVSDVGRFIAAVRTVAGAGPRSIPRWWPSCWPGTPGTSGWAGSSRVSARCWR
jgi:CheY-like chemotaxis protein